MTVIDILFRALARLPLPWLHRLGALLGLAVYALSPAWRGHLLANLGQSGLDRPGRARRSACEAGRALLELPYLWLRPATDILARTGTQDWDLIHRARQEGRGIVFLTPHLGSFEVTALRFAIDPEIASPITVLYRPPRKSWLRPIVEHGRVRANLNTAPADLSGVRRLVRALRRGEAVGLLPDQVPSVGEGVWAPFFGRPAYTMTLPARLAELGGATILLAYGERLAHGAGWTVHIRALADVPPGSPEQQATYINAAMETLIAQLPDQYGWGYDRYKVPRGVAPPAQEDPCA